MFYVAEEDENHHYMGISMRFVLVDGRIRERDFGARNFERVHRGSFSRGKFHLKFTNIVIFC